MAVYKRKPTSKFYTMDFYFQGQRIFESTGVRTQTLAERAERNRITALEEGRAGIKKPVPIRTFEDASTTWLEMKRVTFEHHSARIEGTNLGHLLPVFGKTLVSDITPESIAAYQKARRKAGYAGKTINLEIGTLRAILKYTGNWAAIQPNVKLLKVREDVGIALSAEHETILLEACSLSRSRALVPFVVLALYTGRRFGVLRRLKWSEIDFAMRAIFWGKGKTAAGDYKTLPMNARVYENLRMWAENFPHRQPHHYVFPSERVGMSGHRFQHGAPVYTTNPLKHMDNNKTAWVEAKKRAGWILAGRPEVTGEMTGPPPMVCRMHDLRHTASTRMQADGVPLNQIADLLGWSKSTTVLMAKRYSHFSMEELRTAAESMAGTKKDSRNSESRHISRHVEGASSSVLPN